MVGTQCPVFENKLNCVNLWFSFNTPRTGIFYILYRISISNSQRTLLVSIINLSQEFGFLL